MKTQQDRFTARIAAAIIALVVIALALPALAQGRGFRGKGGPPSGDEIRERAAAHILGTLEEIGASPEVLAAAEPLLDVHADKIAALRGQLSALRQDRRASGERGPVAEHREQAKALHDQLTAERESFVADVVALLTPEQAAAFQDAMDAMPFGPHGKRGFRGQEPCDGNGPHGRFGAPSPEEKRARVEKRITRTLEQVGASEAQIAAVPTILDAHQGTMTGLMEQLRALRADWRDQGARTPAAEHRAQAEALHEQLTAERAAILAEIAATLTPEQAAAFQEKMDKAPFGKRGRRGHGDCDGAGPKGRGCPYVE
jgi:Spy/CpxP family protein refolding chaperone